MIASKGLATRPQFSSVAGKEMSEGAAREITRMFQGSPREPIRAALAAYDKDKDPTKLLQVLLRSPDGELRSAAADCIVRRYPDQLLNIQAFSPQGYQAVLEVLLRNIGEERYPSDGSAPAILALRVFKQEMDIRNLAVQVLVCSRGRNSFLARYVKQEDLEHHCRQLSLDPNTDQELLLQLVTSSGAMRDWGARHLPPERLPRRDFFGRLVLPSIAFSRDHSAPGVLERLTPGNVLVSALEVGRYVSVYSAPVFFYQLRRLGALVVQHFEREPVPEALYTALGGEGKTKRQTAAVLLASLAPLSLPRLRTLLEDDKSPLVYRFAFKALVLANHSTDSERLVGCMYRLWDSLSCHDQVVACWAAGYYLRQQLPTGDRNPASADSLIEKLCQQTQEGQRVSVRRAAIRAVSKLRAQGIDWVTRKIEACNPNLDFPRDPRSERHRLRMEARWAWIRSHEVELHPDWGLVFGQRPDATVPLFRFRGGEWVPRPIAEINAEVERMLQR